jgi:hypothetical protein
LAKSLESKATSAGPRRGECGAPAADWRDKEVEIVGAVIAGDLVTWHQRLAGAQDQLALHQFKFRVRPAGVVDVACEIVTAIGGVSRGPEPAAKHRSAVVAVASMVRRFILFSF